MKKPSPPEQLLIYGHQVIMVTLTTYLGNMTVIVIQTQKRREQVRGKKKQKKREQVRGEEGAGER